MKLGVPLSEDLIQSMQRIYGVSEKRKEKENTTCAIYYANIYEWVLKNLCLRMNPYDWSGIGKWIKPRILFFFCFLH